MLVFRRCVPAHSCSIALSHLVFHALTDVLREVNPKGIQLGISNRYSVDDNGMMFFPYDAPLTSAEALKRLESGKK